MNIFRRKDNDNDDVIVRNIKIKIIKEDTLNCTFDLLIQRKGKKDVVIQKLRKGDEITLDYSIKII